MTFDFRDHRGPTWLEHFSYQNWPDRDRPIPKIRRFASYVPVATQHYFDVVEKAGPQKRVETSVREQPLVRRIDSPPEQFSPERFNGTE